MSDMSYIKQVIHVLNFDVTSGYTTFFVTIYHISADQTRTPKIEWIFY